MAHLLLPAPVALQPAPVEPGPQAHRMAPGHADDILSRLGFATHHAVVSSAPRRPAARRSAHTVASTAHWLPPGPLAAIGPPATGTLATSRGKRGLHMCHALGPGRAQLGAVGARKRGTPSWHMCTPPPCAPPQSLALAPAAVVQLMLRHWRGQESLSSTVRARASSCDGARRAGHVDR